MPNITGPKSHANDAMPEAEIDAVESGRVYGWAWDPAEPEKRQTVAVYCGDQILGTVLADRHRVDLATRGIGDGRHAFVFDVPPTAKDRLASEFRVTLSREPKPVSRAPKVFTINPDGEVAKMIKQPEPGDAALLRDPGEVAHALKKQVQSISQRLDQVDANYGKMTDLLARMDQKLTADTAALHKQITSQSRAILPPAQAAVLPSETLKASVQSIEKTKDFQKLKQYVRVCWRDIKKLRRDLETVESFTLRFDERLKETAKQGDLEMVQQGVKVTRGLLWIAMIMAGLSMSLSLYAFLTSG